MSGIELLKANRDEHGYWQTVRRVARQDTVLNAAASRRNVPFRCCRPYVSQQPSPVLRLSLRSPWVNPLLNCIPDKCRSSTEAGVRSCSLWG
jgi:hypothetical protein